MQDSTQLQQGGRPIWSVFKIEDAFGPVTLGGSNRVKRVWFHIVGMPDDYVDVPIDSFIDSGKLAAAIQQHVDALISAITLKSVEHY